MKIYAIYSSSRLGFDDWFNSVMRMVQNLGIPTARCSGGYWEQRITEALETYSQIEEIDYLLTMDGDSWFLPGHIQMLYELMRGNPEYDCLVPVQVRRNGVEPLFTLADEKGQKKDSMTIKEIRRRNGILPIRTGHLGLTVFKKEVFRKTPKPWFWSQPNKNGEWKEGKIDADTWFWGQFAKAGLRAGLATNISIGHLQLVCTVPDCIEHSFAPIHVMMNDLEAGKIPIHCVPSIEGE